MGASGAEYLANTVAALKALLDDILTTRGDLLTRDNAGDIIRKALGASGTILRSDGSDPGWATLATALGQANARAKKTGAQTIANNTTTTLTFDAEDWDDGAMHDNAVNNSRLTAPVAGLYFGFVSVEFGASAAGDRQVSLGIGGADTVIESVRATSANPTRVASAGLFDMTAGQYLDARVYQNSGGNLDVAVAGTYIGAALLVAQ